MVMVIAGATGRTGRAVAEALLARGVETRVLVRTEQSAREYRARGADARVLSLEDSASLGAALQGASALYALLPEELHNPSFRAKRSAITESLTNAVRLAEVPHVVLLSARAAALSGGNGHAADLHVAERSLARVSVLTALRAAPFQDNLVPALSMAKESGLYLNFYPESASISMIATRDVAQLAVEALLHPPQRSEVVDLLGPSYSPGQIVNILSTLLDGKHVRVVEVAARHQVGALREAGLSPEGANGLVQLLACVARPELLPKGDRTVVGSTPLASTLRAALAFRPVAAPPASLSSSLEQLS